MRWALGSPQGAAMWCVYMFERQHCGNISCFGFPWVICKICSVMERHCLLFSLLLLQTAY